MDEAYVGTGASGKLAEPVNDLFVPGKAARQQAVCRARLRADRMTLFVDIQITGSNTPERYNTHKKVSRKIQQWGKGVSGINTKI